MRPSATLVSALCILLGAAAVLALFRSMGWSELSRLLTSGWFALSVLGAVLVLVDGYNSIRQPKLSVQRRLPGSLALDAVNTVKISIENPTLRRVKARFVDHYPAKLQATGVPVALEIPAEGEVTLKYQVRPIERGDANFDRAELELVSPWGFWTRSYLSGEVQSIRIFPNFMALDTLRELSYERSAAFLGIHLQQRRGEGTDFMQLREFREGDPLRQIDWKATSRLGKMLSREYQDEQDQDVIFLLDCGRRMHTRDAELSHFDHSLNAILLTAYFALRQGDGVGICGFAGKDLWLKPVKHASSMRVLLDRLYDVRSTTQSSDFLNAAQLISARHHKRALVILVTNIQPEDGDDLTQAIGMLRSQHALIIANLREDSLAQVLDSTIEDRDSALQYCAAVDLHHRNKRVMEGLKKQGVFITDCLPRQMHYQLVSQYLAMKRAKVV